VSLDGDAAGTRSPAFRIEVVPGEHVALQLDFTPAQADVVLEVLRWDGRDAQPLGATDAGPGLRVLAVADMRGPRTFWVRAREAAADVGGLTLRVTRTPFEDGPRCEDDCARLLQLPLPNDPVLDGYEVSSATVFRYQFGRRDLLMMIRWAGLQVAGAGMSPFQPADLSQWNGETPGNDVGAPRHVSHQRGKDVDISLYGTDGLATWRSYCTAERTERGRECVAGTRTGFDAHASAFAYAPFLASGRVTNAFLDAELIEAEVPAAAEIADEGLIDPALVPLFGDGRHLQHWPNHDNHIHVRVSEEPYGVAPLLREPAPVEAP
jgi:hypothetical protein